MLAVLILILLASVPGLASAPKYLSTRKLTVAELEQFLSGAHGAKDKHLAERIYNLKLTERLSDEVLGSLERIPTRP